MIDVSIEIPELGVFAAHAEIIDNHTDVAKMLMTICVGLFSDSGDKLKVIQVQHQLIGFPIPSIEEQWAIAMPLIEKMQETQ